MTPDELHAALAAVLRRRGIDALPADPLVAELVKEAGSYAAAELRAAADAWEHYEDAVDYTDAETGAWLRSRADELDGGAR